MEPGNHGDQRKLFVGGLPNNATKETVTAYFSQFGDVLGVDIPTHPNGGNSRGFCFVCFHDVDSAQRALNHAEHIIHDKKVEVKQAIPKSSDTTNNKLSRLSKKIFVGGLPQDCTNEELREHFESFGTVVDAFVVANSHTSKNRGFGFVTFETYAAAENALNSRSQMLKNKLIEVKPAEQKTTNTSPSNPLDSGNGNGIEAAIGAMSLFQGNNVVHGQYNLNGYFDFGGVNTVSAGYFPNMAPYGYNLQNDNQCGAGYLMYPAYSNPYNYQDYYQPFPITYHGYCSGQGPTTAAAQVQNGQDSPPAEELPQTPSGEAQVQPPQQNEQDGPWTGELPQTPNGDGQVQPPVQNGRFDPPEEESPKTPSGESDDGQVQAPHQIEQDGPPPPPEELPQTLSDSSPDHATSSDDQPVIR